LAAKKLFGAAADAASAGSEVGDLLPSLVVRESSGPAPV
jgi:hypothetical protein